MTAPPPTLDDALFPAAGLRRIRADEAPYPGALHGGEPMTVWVDADLIPDAAWNAKADGHLLAPLEVVRTRTGHCAVVVHCPDRLRARIDGATLSAGEAVTVAVSVVRAAAEAERLGLATGAWWVDERGRPVLAAGGDRPWRDEAVALLEALGAQAAGAAAVALAAAAASVRDPEVLRRGAEECEDALFEVAPAAPLREAAPLPERVPESMPPRSPRAATDAAESWLAQHLDRDLSRRLLGALRQAGEGAGRAFAFVRAGRPHPPRPASDRPGPTRQGVASRRRAPWLLAAGVAAAILAGGLLWPTDEESTAAVVAGPVPGAAASSRAESVAPAADEPPPPRDGSAPGDDLLSAATAALDALAACLAAGAESCPAWEHPGSIAPAGAATIAEAQRTLTLLDEYGGVAVMRVESDGAPTQVVVLVRADEKWLVREIYDLADQP